MKERCPHCNHKLKAKKRHFDEPFGASTIDELARAIYGTFHRHPSDNIPWDLFAKCDGDHVVAVNRRAAQAAAQTLIDAGVGIGAYKSDAR
jgi:hypothetical protein